MLRGLAFLCPAVVLGLVLAIVIAFFAEMFGYVAGAPRVPDLSALGNDRNEGGYQNDNEDLFGDAFGRNRPESDSRDKRDSLANDSLESTGAEKDDSLKNAVEAGRLFVAESPAFVGYDEGTAWFESTAHRWNEEMKNYSEATRLLGTTLIIVGQNVLILDEDPAEVSKEFSCRVLLADAKHSTWVMSAEEGSDLVVMACNREMNRCRLRLTVYSTPTRSTVIEDRAETRVTAP